MLISNCPNRDSFTLNRNCIFFGHLFFEVFQNNYCSEIFYYLHIQFNRYLEEQSQFCNQVSSYAISQQNLVQSMTQQKHEANGTGQLIFLTRVIKQQIKFESGTSLSRTADQELKCLN
ncbi:unnamed protein product [Paramecium octaurelia]|uniref:Uncharacterized protein n=1 Tax=Paramecium octaurelia TaxID=43137 RepID=A0A8S1Y3X2_PAROT|nr:unnamed protein product [Paramecium octaurelia]